MKALVIGGGLPQIELIRQLHERGIVALLADIISDAVAAPYCDKFFLVESGFGPIRKIATEEKVDFLITVCADQILLDMAKVSEELGLPCYINYKTAQDVSNKIRMKRIFQENAIPSTKYVETESLDIEVIEQLSYPLVVKPVDAFSSRGVRKVNNVDELKCYYDEARKISRTGGVIVEEFFCGDEISVDAFVVHGKAHVLTITNSEKVKDKDRFVIFRGRYPANISETVLKKIEDVVQKIAESFGLVNSPLLVQLLSDGENISVLEFCARTGGNMKYLLIKYASGVDVIGATIDIILGKEPDLRPKYNRNNLVVNDFVYCKPSILDHFEGFEELESAGIINEFHPVRLKGAQVRGVMSSTDRVAGMNIVANSIEEYNDKLNIINQTVKVIDNQGFDIMRHDLLPELK